MTGLILAGATAQVLYLLLLILRGKWSLQYAHRHRETEIRTGEVTVLTPILSGDPDLEEVLRTNLERAPDGCRFLWLIDQDDSAAHAITRRLQGEAPGRVRILDCPPPRPGRNPKLAKLEQGRREVTTAYLAVLDDDTMLLHSNIARALAGLDTHDLYTGLPFYQSTGGIWSLLVSQFVNNNSALTYLATSRWLPAITINGMFYVMRTERLDRLGGLASIEDRLCDDYAVAGLVLKNGGTIHQGTTPLLLRTTVDGPWHYVSLMHRWFVFANLLLDDQPWRRRGLLFLLLGCPALLLWTSPLTLLAGWWGLFAWAVFLVVRQLMLNRLVAYHSNKMARLSAWASVVAEFLQPLHWIHARCHRVIRWRSHRIRPTRDGRFRYLEQVRR